MYIKKTAAFVLMLSLSAFSVIQGISDKPEMTDIKIYVADADLGHLLPINESIIKGDAQFMAAQSLRRLIQGYEKNRKIRRLLPTDKSCMSVKVDKNTAYIDIKTKYFEKTAASRDIEKMTVYQIVNTVTSVDGIDSVKFTLDGARAKTLGGFLDMRLLYTPDYPI